MKKAIVLGGTEDHIRLVEILKQKGYYTVLIDFYENPPAKSVADEHIRESTLDLDKVKQIAKKINPMLVITACIDQALLTMAYVSEELELPCHLSYQTALELTNKVYMKRRFVENGIPTSKFFILEEISSYKDMVLKFPVVVKPADSNSSKGITKVEFKENIGGAVSYAFSHSRSQKVVIEDFVEGKELSVDVAVKDFEPTVLMVTKNIKSVQNKNNFTIVRNLYPAITDNILLGKIKEIAKKIAHCYRIKNGPLLIQLMYDGTNISVVEFSSRIGGGSKHHFIKKMISFDLLDWFVNVLLNEVGEISVCNNFKYGSVNYIYAQNGVISQFIGFDELKNKGVIDDYFYYKTVGMPIDNHISSADRPAGYMIVDNYYESYRQKIVVSAKNLKILDTNRKNMIINYGS